MITVKLQGRLGNRLFQIASAMGIARKFGYGFVPGLIGFPEFKIPWGYHELDIPDNVCLVGYMQSEKYFKNYELAFKYFADTFRLDKYSDCIAIHLRHGDYGTKKHPRLPDRYYIDALKLMPNKRTLIFSDDINYEADFGERISTGSELEDLRIMASCGYHIIANSTFSWWGAYLARSKKVIAPKLWFGTDLDASDIYYEGWTII